MKAEKSRDHLPGNLVLNTMKLGRIVNLLEAAAYAKLWQTHGEVVVVTNGCFDILHVGHVRLLAAAKAKGHRLIVGVNTDAAVQALKGPDRPINSQNARAEVVAGLRSVDMVVLVDDINMCDFLDSLRPNIWAKGGDYTRETLNQHEVAVAAKVGADIALLGLVEGVSTTHVIEQIQAGSAVQTDRA